MKKKNLVKKTLLPALVAVLCSLVALTSVSYAWFTLGNTASVGRIDVNVTAADGLQISADASSWKSVLPVDELKPANAYTGNKNVFPVDDIAPMSSAGKVVNGFQEMFFGELQADGATIVTEQLDEADAKNFIAFDLFINLNVDKTLYLLDDSTVVALSGAESDCETAVRVSFVNLGTAAAAADALALTVASGEALIWEPNATTHIDAVGGSSILEYRGVNAESAVAFGVADTTNTTLMSAVKQFEEAADVTTIDAETGDGIKLFDLSAGYSKIRVYIWLEGQDADCLNIVSGGGFSVNLQFATNKN